MGRTIKPDLDGVFAALRALLEPYVDKFEVTERKGYYSLDDHSIPGWSIDFAAVVAKARAVSFYLRSGDYDPAILSPALAAHRKKAAFLNFTAVDDELFAEIGRHLAATFAAWDPKAIVNKHRK